MKKKKWKKKWKKKYKEDVCQQILGLTRLDVYGDKFVGLDSVLHVILDKSNEQHKEE